MREPKWEPAGWMALPTRGHARGAAAVRHAVAARWQVRTLDPSAQQGPRGFISVTRGTKKRREGCEPAARTPRDLHSREMRGVPLAAVFAVGDARPGIGGGLAGETFAGTVPWSAPSGQEPRQSCGYRGSMYLPAHFAAGELDEIAAFVDRAGAADLVTFDGTRPVSTLLPVIWDRSEEHTS